LPLYSSSHSLFFLRVNLFRKPFRYFKEDLPVRAGTDGSFRLLCDHFESIGIGAGIGADRVVQEAEIAGSRGGEGAVGSAAGAAGAAGAAAQGGGMWQQLVNAETNTAYFHSHDLDQVSWEIPFQVGWTSHVQEDTGYVYFANDSTGEVSWTRPEKPGEMVVVDAGDGGDAAALPGGVFDRYVEYVYIIFSVATHMYTEKYNASH
jgi:hypothetical protein